MKWKSFAGPGAILLLVLYPLFGRLGVIPIQLWDESRLAVHAIEMLRNHNWLVLTFNGLPDMIDTKPPLLIWIQALSLKLFGYSELAIRLPSAMAALGTCLLVYLPFGRKGRDPLTGVIAALVLVTAPGFVGLHCCRTGEYDSLLTMLTMGYIVCFFLYVDENHPKFLLATLIFLTLATLTKGIQALIYCPALLIYSVYKDKIFKLFRVRELYIGVAVLLFFAGGYLVLREHINPGYFKALQDNDMGGRYYQALDGHRGKLSYYYNILVKYYFSYWYILVVPGVALGIFSVEKWKRDLALLCFYSGFLYISVISNAETKVFWYLMPLYPLLAIMVGMFLGSFCQLLGKIDVQKVLTVNILPWLFLFFVFFYPYLNVTNIVNNDYTGLDKDPQRRSMLFFMSDVLHKRITGLEGATFINDDFNTDISWYFKAFDMEGRPIRAVSREDIAPDSKIVAYLPDSKAFLESNFNAQVLHSWDNVTLYQLQGRKP